MNDNSSNKPEQLGHEPSEPRMVLVTLSLAGFIAITLFALVVVAFVLAGFSATHGKKVIEASAGPAPNPPSGVPILDPHLADDLEQLRARERHLLTQYKWIDEKAGIARIPIRRAIDILSARAMKSEPQRVPARTNNE